MWSQMESAGIELRPDKCHVIFEKCSDDVICARIEKDCKPSNLVLGQLRAFNNEGFSILMFTGNRATYFLNDSHTRDYVRGVISDSA
jgi:hypothetical protein